MTTNGDRQQRKGRLQMLAMASIFLGPLAVAAYLYFGPSEWRPAGRTNHGTLVHPVISLPESLPPSPYGIDAESATSLHGKWTIAYLRRGDCDTECEQTLIKIRQIRLAIGAEADRIQRLFLAGGQLPDAAWIEAGHAGLITVQLVADSELGSALTSLSDGIYLIDPLGNLMMAYPVDAESKAIHTDLKKLLKTSRIG